jgi:hypothetical protein
VIVEFEDMEVVDWDAAEMGHVRGTTVWVDVVESEDEDEEVEGAGETTRGVDADERLGERDGDEGRWDNKA